MTDAALNQDVDEATDQQAAPAAPAKRRNLKKLLLFIGAPLVLIGGGAGAYFTGLLDPLLAMAGMGAEVEQANAEGEAVNNDVIFHDLPDMLVNLNTSGRQNSFLKMQVALELDGDADLQLLESMMPRVIDNFQVYLRELHPEELKGSEGLYRLKEELLLRVNQSAAPVHVRDVLFKQVLVQ